MSWGPIAATNRFVRTEEFLWKSLSPQQNFVAATCRKKSNQTEFVWLVTATTFHCTDKDFHKNSLVHTKWFVPATCPCNVSPWRVAATTNCTRPTCTHGMICCCRLVAASCLNSLIDKLIHVSIINPTSHSVTIKTTYMYKALHYGLSDWPTNCPIQWQSHYLDMSDPDQCIIEIHSLSGNCKKWSSNKYMTLSWSLIVH